MPDTPVEVTTFAYRFKRSVDTPDPRPDGAVPFFADRGGAGDMLMHLGFVKGYRERGVPSWVVSRRDDYKDLLSLFGETPGTDMEGAHELGGLNPNYAPYMKRPVTDDTPYYKYCGASYPQPANWVHPVALPDPDNEAWANNLWDTLPGEGTKVLICPFAAWPVRNWPFSSYVDLGWELHHRGFRVIFILPNEEHRPSVPFSVWGMRWSQSAALMKGADWVISNDTGPAHLAGALSRNTLALCGPTIGMMAQWPTVLEVHVSKSAMPCVGCWFREESAHRAACDKGCRALSMITPESLVEVLHESPERLFRPGGLYQSGQTARPMAGVSTKLGTAPYLRGPTISVRRLDTP